MNVRNGAQSPFTTAQIVPRARDVLACESRNPKHPSRVPDPPIRTRSDMTDVRLGVAPTPTHVRHAVCVTGLERAYSEVRWNIRAAIFGFLASSAPQTHIRVFGVRPVNDSWPHAMADFATLIDTIELQRSCRPVDAPLPQWFSCTRGSSISRMGDCTRSFVQMMCDLCVRHIIAPPISHLASQHQPLGGSPSLIAALPIYFVRLAGRTVSS